MAQLTWRNVDAPNFSGAAAGYKAFSDLISNAGKTASDAIGAYDDASRMETANPGIQAYFQQAAQGNPNAAKEALAQHYAAFSNLRPDQLSKVFNDGSGIVKTNLSNQADYFKSTIAQRTDADQQAATSVLNKISPGLASAQDVYPVLRNSKEYNALSEAGKRLVQQGVTGMGYQFQGPSAIGGASSLGSGSPATAAIGGAVETGFPSLDPKQAQRLQSVKFAPEHIAAIDSASGGDASKAAWLKAAVTIENRGKPAPDNNAVSPAEAVGAFQFIPGTGKQYGLSGEDRKDFTKSAGAAGKFYDDLYKIYNGNQLAMLAHYNGGGAAGAAVMAGKEPPAQETRDYVNMGRALGIGVDTATALAAQARPNTGARKDGADSKNELQLRVAQDNAGGMANVFAAMEDTKSTPASIAAQWADQKKFMGASPEALVGTINKMVSKYGKYGVTASVAGAILENGGMTGITDWSEKLGNVFNAESLGNWTMNADYIEEQVNALKNNKTLVNASANQGTAMASNMLKTYLDEQAAARTELSGLAAAARDRPELLDQAVPRAQRRLDAADAMLRQLSASQQSTSNLQPVLDRPQPVATTVAGKATSAIAAAASSKSTAPITENDLNFLNQYVGKSATAKEFNGQIDQSRPLRQVAVSQFDGAVKKKVEIPQTSVSTGEVVGKVSPPTATPLNPEPTTTTRSSSVSLDTSKPSSGIVDTKTVSIPKVEWEPPQTLEQAMEDPSLLGSVADMRKHVLTFVPQKGVATKVTDGDGARVTLDNGTKLNCRIDSINAPETEKSFLSPPRPGQPVAEESKRYLQDLIENKQVTVRITRPAESGKNYSRDLCQISIEGKNVDVSMVQANMAYIYDRYVSNKNNTAHSRLFDLLQAKKQGMQTPSGVRALPSAEDPEKFNRRFQ